VGSGLRSSYRCGERHFRTAWLIDTRYGAWSPGLCVPRCQRIDTRADPAGFQDELSSPDARRTTKWPRDERSARRDSGTQPMTRALLTLLLVFARLPLVAAQRKRAVQQPKPVVAAVVAAARQSAAAACRAVSPRSRSRSPSACTTVRSLSLGRQFGGEDTADKFQAVRSNCPLNRLSQSPDL
jgi:hypothetical protein